ncbi:MAG: YcxB family protein [Oscillospiraceae bacterium]|nr:YcxB family protein [Oscillospiraceae bacterium]
MKCLYTTKTEYNYDEFKRYNWTMLIARGKLAQHLLLELVFLIIAIVVPLIFHRFQVLALIPALYPLIVVVLYVFRVRKAYTASGAPRSMTVNYEFYETELVERLDKGSAHYPYAKLQNLVETKTNVYLLLPGNVSIVLVKKNFPEGLTEFVRTIIPNGEEMRKLKN